MLKLLLESMLEGELDHHLHESKASRAIKRKKGKTKKTDEAFSRNISNWRVAGTETALSSQK